MGQEVQLVPVHIVCSGEPADFSFDVVETDGQVATREISAAPLRSGETVVGIFGLSTPGQPGRHPLPRSRSHHTLTGRQLEILQLLAEGKSTTQIAAERPPPVEDDRPQSHREPDGESRRPHRVQALVVASRQGLIRLH